MKRFLTTTWKLSVAGDNNELCSLLRVKVPWAYEQWLDSRSDLFSDDPDSPCNGLFTLTNCGQLIELLAVLATAHTVSDASLWVSAGDAAVGFHASLNNRKEHDTIGEWRGDEQVMTQAFGAVFAEIKRLLGTLECTRL